jgi:hypothetical protein
MEDDEMRKRLWKVLRGEAGEIPALYGSAFGPVYYSGANSALAIKDVTREDGGTDVHILKAVVLPHWHVKKGQISVTKKLAYSENDVFWQEQHDNPAGAVRVDGIHYRIGNSQGGARGCGGARWRFRWLATGADFTTDDLWRQGTIPPGWRKRLPDNAVHLCLTCGEVLKKDVGCVTCTPDR